ncbi:hypothetical protein BSKO_09468 [Bryopsis sp. KO-2023]|nr:hypothetical protein BSKO_09468 [Bryopsis sp. KO-2023]
MASKRVQNPVVCPGHSRPIVEVNFSTETPDGLFLVSASKDGCPMLRNGDSGDWIGTFEGHKGAVWSAVLNTPALLAATGSADFTARVWDAVSGDEKAQFQHKHIVRSVQFARKRDLLATGGAEKIIRLFDLGRPEESEEFDPTIDNVQHLAFCQDDKSILASYATEKGISVFDARTKKVVKTLETPNQVTSIEVAADGSLFTTTDGNFVRFWNSATLEQIKEFEMEVNIGAASLNLHFGKFVVGGEDMSVRLYDFNSGEELENNRKHHGPVHTVQFAPSGRTYASGSEDGTIRLWDTWLGEMVSDGNGNVSKEDPKEGITAQSVEAIAA